MREQLTLIAQSRGRFDVQSYRHKKVFPYLDMMSHDNCQVLIDTCVAKVLRDQGFQLTSENPRSVYKVEKLFDALSKYAPGLVPTPAKVHELYSGIAFARTCFARPLRMPKLHMLPFTRQTVSDITTNPQASAGLTAWGEHKVDAVDRAFERGVNILFGKRAPEPCIAFKRTQFNDKTRLVWGYPYAMTAIEGVVARPLIDFFLSWKNHPMAFGMSTCHLGARLRMAARRRKWAYSVDMSSFDSSISAFLIHQAFDIIKTWFHLDEVDAVTGHSCEEFFRVIERYFIHTPIVMPDRNVYFGKDHGVPSGSYFTQMVDSIVNVIIAGTLSAKFKLQLYKEDVFVLGDDLLMWSNRDLGLNELAKYAQSVFHVKFNADKSTKTLWSDPVHYLGRDWHRGVPDLSLDKVLQRAVFPERYRVRSSDPSKRNREVLLLLASLACTYRGAGQLLTNCYFRGKRRISLSAIEQDIYDVGKGINPEHLSGYQRFKEKYIFKDDRRLSWLLLQFLS